MSTTGPPSYRERLRIEGGVLAACGALGSAALLSATSEASRGPVSTAVQLGIVALFLLVFGYVSARRSLDRAVDVPVSAAGSGEPTPLWQLPLIVAGLTIAVGLVDGWDGGLHVAGGCTLVGLAQAVLIERVVAARERGLGVRYVRLPGSRIVRGTKLGRLNAGTRGG